MLFGTPDAVVSTGSVDHVTTLYRFADGPRHVVAEGGWDQVPGLPFHMTYRVTFERATADFDFQRDPLLLAPRKLRRVMPGPLSQPDGGKFCLGTGKRIAHPGQFQRRGDIFQRRHCRDQVERLENHPHIVPAEAGQRILAHGRQVLAERIDPPRRGGFKPADEHKER